MSEVSRLFAARRSSIDVYAAHNRGVAGDALADACRCTGCNPDRLSESQAALAVAAAPLPSSHESAHDRDAQRPVVRGPVQDESGRLDPIDARAMREIEGSNPDADFGFDLIAGAPKAERGEAGKP
jgi:hypothetical protein